MEQIEHLEEILRNGTAGDSPIALKRGLETMLVVAAAHLSSQLRRPVGIDYGAGFSQQALKLF